MMYCVCTLFYALYNKHTPIITRPISRHFLNIKMMWRLKLQVINLFRLWNDYFYLHFARKNSCRKNVFEGQLFRSSEILANFSCWVVYPHFVLQLPKAIIVNIINYSYYQNSLLHSLWWNVTKYVTHSFTLQGVSYLIAVK